MDLAVNDACCIASAANLNLFTSYASLQDRLGSGGATNGGVFAKCLDMRFSLIVQAIFPNHSLSIIKGSGGGKCLIFKSVS
jgi:hypothetical protein